MGPAGLTYKTSFVLSDLSAGILTVNHNLGARYVSVVVYDDSYKLIMPDEVEVSNSNTSLVDLSSFTSTFTGTWSVVVLAGVAGVSAGGSTYFFSDVGGSLWTTGSTAFIGGGDESMLTSPSDKGTDVFFYVSGSTGGSDRVLFGGDIVTSGSILPGLDREKNLGSETRRWANIYTGDLHLKNERGDWTLIEEEEFLTIRNNKTGKRYKLSMEPLD
jgi:hypothetical protein